MKGIENFSSGKVKYDSLTGKSVIDTSISRFGPYVDNKIPRINNKNYVSMLLSKKNIFINYQPRITYLTASRAIYCTLGILIKTYHLFVSFTLSQRTFHIKS